MAATKYLRTTFYTRPIARQKQLGGPSKLVKQNYPPPPPHPVTQNTDRSGSFKRGNKNVKKVVYLVRKANICILFGTFFAVSFTRPSYIVEFPNFTFEGGRKQTTTNSSFSF